MTESARAIHLPLRAVGHACGGSSNHGLRGVALLFWSSTIALAVVACGGADAPAPKSPNTVHERTKDERPEPKTVEEAQNQIAEARADLEGVKKATDSKATAAPPAPAPEKSPQSPQGGAAGREERAGAEDACGSPCRALASMRRAVEALCRMTGDGDNRCVDAKRTLTESTTRVSSCKCEGR